MAQVMAAVAFVGEVISLIILVTTYVRKVKKQTEKIRSEIDKLTDGMKCQLRSDMLRIYYHNRDNKTIRQYEYENFVMLYEAYKALKGNSFIDKIYDEVKKWTIIT